MHYFDEDERDRDREKLSWREIDKKRDGGYHRGEKSQNEQEPKRERKQTYAHMQYKKKLEEFFNVGKKKEDKQRDSELKKIKEIKGKAQFMKAADEFIQKYGLPKDLDFLLSMLDHKDSKTIEESLKLIETLYAEETDTRKDIIKQKVHILEMTATDPKIQGFAEDVLTRMN